MEGNSSKKRSANFNTKEEACLVSLVKKYKSIVECKMSDTQINRQKADCWSKIENEFNGAMGEIFRPKEVLRKKYENIKKMVKKKYAEEKCFMKGTGGGPPKDMKFTEVDSEVKEMLGARVEGFASEFDGDTGGPSCNKQLQFCHNEDQQTTKNLQLLPAEDVQLEIIEVSAVDDIEKDNQESKKTYDKTYESNTTDWSTYTPKMLRTKKSAVLQVSQSSADSVKTRKNKPETSSKVCQWIAAKTSLEETNRVFAEEKHKLILQHMQEKHELEMQLLRSKADLEAKLMEEEHKKKMEIMSRNK